MYSSRSCSTFPDAAKEKRRRIIAANTMSNSAFTKCPHPTVRGGGAERWDCGFRLMGLRQAHAARRGHASACPTPGVQKRSTAGRAGVGQSLCACRASQDAAGDARLKWMLGQCACLLLIRAWIPGAIVPHRALSAWRGSTSRWRLLLQLAGDSGTRLRQLWPR